MSYLNQSSRLAWGMCVFILVFIFSPVLSTQPDAHPGALYVVAFVLPIFFMALQGDFFKPCGANLYAVLLFVFALLSTIFADYGDFNFRTVLKYFLFIVLFISTSSFVLPPKQLKFAFKSYLYLSVILSILIILSFIFGFPHIEVAHFQNRYSIGITGLFKNPNYITSFYNVAFFVICYLLATVKLSFKKKVVLFSILVLFLISSYLSGTRAALLVEFLIIISMPLVMSKRRRFNLIILLTLLIAIVVVNFYDEIDLALSLFLGNRDAFADEGRSDAWSVAFKYISNHPIFGCGHNSWSTISQGTGYLEYLHNIFLELLLDQGIIGLLLFIGVITSGYRKTKKVDRSFLFLLLLFTAIPMLFQNGLYEVNFWRFVIINRLMMNVSTSYDGGIKAFLKNTFGVAQKNEKLCDVSPSPSLVELQIS